MVKCKKMLAVMIMVIVCYTAAIGDIHATEVLNPRPYEFDGLKDLRLFDTITSDSYLYDSKVYCAVGIDSQSTYKTLIRVTAFQYAQ